MGIKSENFKKIEPTKKTNVVLSQPSYRLINPICILQNSPFFQRYDINLKEAILGDGSFSVCRRCIDRTTGTEYAVKIVSKRVDCSSEIRLLKQCQGHPNVVQLIDILQVKPLKPLKAVFLKRFYKPKLHRIVNHSEKSTSCIKIHAKP